MQTQLHTCGTFSPNDHLLILADEGHFEWADTFLHDILTQEEIRFLQQACAQKIPSVTIPHPERIVTVLFLKDCDNEYLRREKARRAGAEMLKSLLHLKINAVTVVNRCGLNMTLQVVEGMVLANYQFLKYVKNAAERSNTLFISLLHFVPALRQKLLPVYQYFR